MGFIHKEVINAHIPEIDTCIFLFFYVFKHPLQLAFQVVFAYLQAFKHFLRDFTAKLFDRFQVTFYIVQFRLEYTPLYFRRLRYFSKLIVRQYDTVPIVVFDLMEKS